VVDLLIQVKGHTLIDRTDGPADEKQDILTLDAAGKRHLTQCKHTIHYEKKTNGDELDLLFGACHRKNCHTGLYVTNADLTPQAKRYVTDAEYLRLGQATDTFAPRIDYWNAQRIWDQVAQSNAILNKWFSGMAQAHALRKFFFDVVATRMPDGAPCEQHAEDFAQLFAYTCAMTPAANGSFDVQLDPTLLINLSNWFRGAGELGVPFLPPTDHPWIPNALLRTVRVQASLSESVGAYQVATYRDRIAKALAALLPDAGSHTWSHLVVTAPQAFVFLQDIAKSALVAIEEPETFVRIGAAEAAAERLWACQPGADYSRAPTDEDDDLSWLYRGAAITLRIFISQPIHPMQSYELQLRQERIVQQLHDHTFRALEHADAAVTETVRRLVDPQWFVLQSTRGELFWTYPPDANPRQIEKLESALLRQNVEVLAVKDEDLASLLRQVQAPQEFGRMIISGEQASFTPLKLNERMFWIAEEFNLAQCPTSEQVLEVLKYKLTYESQHGFDAFGEAGEHTIASEEMPRLLCDLASMRGRRMIDVHLGKTKLQLNVRFQEAVLQDAAQLALHYAEEFKSVRAAILERLSGTLAAPSGERHPDVPPTT
jgi:hypothetical protein